MGPEEALYTFLGIGKGITAIIGGGGKTTLLMRLGAFFRTRGSVILTTSTHIYPPASIPYRKELSEPLPEGSCISMGTESASGKLTAPLQPFSELSGYADYVFVEADGAKGLPAKAHAPYEPVIPEGAHAVIAVLGLDAAGLAVSEAVHRPEILYAKMHLGADDLLTPGILAKLLMSYPGVTSVLLNKADTEERILNGREIAALLPFPCAITSLLTDHPTYELWRNGSCLLS